MKCKSHNPNGCMNCRPPNPTKSSTRMGLKDPREFYIYERGKCKKCEIHKPTNDLGVCERCDKMNYPSSTSKTTQPKSETWQEEFRDSKEYFALSHALDDTVYSAVQKAKIKEDLVAFISSLIHSKQVEVLEEFKNKINPKGWRSDIDCARTIDEIDTMLAELKKDLE